LRVITELVINHTQTKIHGFKSRAALLPGSVERDFFVSDAAEKYKDARIIFKDFEPQLGVDPVAKLLLASLYSHQRI